MKIDLIDELDDALIEIKHPWIAPIIMPLDLPDINNNVGNGSDVGLLSGS